MPTATADHRDTFRVSKRRRNVPSVRARVQKALADWGIDAALAYDVTLSADELVSNAIKHCRVTLALIEISVSVHDAWLLLEVSDPDGDKIPELRIADSEEETGRGLFMVSQLADEWGHRSRGATAKCVWARFAITRGAPCTD
jgi:anti-sigma regulatory factor (Ser/Thr protein kinase)